MIITNLKNLPLPLYLAICGDTYDPGLSDISTTSLSVPSHIWALRKQHKDEITTDASDRIYSLVGQVGHSIIERLANNPDFIAEKRYYVEIDGKKVGGQIDLYQKSTTTLFDFKFTSYYVSKDGVKKEWEEQANVNAFLLHQAGIEVNRIRYIAIYRDWSVMRAGQGDMPDAGVGVFTVTMWPEEKTVAWIRSRIASHVAALESLPGCSPEERWAKPDQWALMKKGGKRAVKLYDSEAAAQADLAPAHYVEYRKGSDTRCTHFCDVKQFCSYYKTTYGKK